MDHPLIGCPWCGHESIAGADLCDVCQHPLIDVTDNARPKSELEAGIQTDPLSVLGPVEPVSLGPEASVADAIALLAERSIGCVLVVSDGQLVGIFSERDALMKIGTRLDEFAQAPIREFMTPRPATLTADDPIAFALNRMAVGDFRHIPIEADGRPVGIISVRDVLAYLVQQFPEVASGAN